MFEPNDHFAAHRRARARLWVLVTFAMILGAACLPTSPVVDGGASAPSDAGLLDAGPDGGPPVVPPTLDELRTATQNWLQSCYWAFAVELRPTFEPPLQPTLDSLEWSYNAAHVERDGRSLQDCLTALQDEACDLDAFDLCSAGFRGSLQPGQPCRYGAECADGSICNTLASTYSPCGVCAVERPAAGEPCEGAQRCADDAYCDFAAEPRVCVLRPGAGEACAGTICAEGLVCLGEVCTEPAGENGPCTQNNECADGLFCDEQACRPGPGPGEPCAGGQRCSGGAFCVHGVCDVAGVTGDAAGESCSLLAFSSCGEEEITGVTCALDEDAGAGRCVPLILVEPGGACSHPSMRVGPPTAQRRCVGDGYTHACRHDELVDGGPGDLSCQPLQGPGEPCQIGGFLPVGDGLCLHPHLCVPDPVDDPVAACESFNADVMTETCDLTAYVLDCGLLEGSIQDYAGYYACVRPELSCNGIEPVIGNPNACTDLISSVQGTCLEATPVGEACTDGQHCGGLYDPSRCNPETEVCVDRYDATACPTP